VRIELVPGGDNGAEIVVTAALGATGLELHPAPPGYTSAWRRAALADSTGRVDRDEGACRAYALSPRRTRGATRA